MSAFWVLMSLARLDAKSLGPLARGQLVSMREVRSRFLASPSTADGDPTNDGKGSGGAKGHEPAASAVTALRG